jgi:polyisoprenoid-binding protein YceI
MDKNQWLIDHAHSEIAFKERQLLIAHVRGTFKTFDAGIFINAKDLTTAEIDLWIDASSITTGDSKRDELLKGSDFLNVEDHKQIKFTSKTIGKSDTEGNHELWGELAIKGVSKNVKFNMQFGEVSVDALGNEKGALTITGKINRSGWGLMWNSMLETTGLMVSEEITISCDVELTHAGQKDLAELEPSSKKMYLM